MIRLLASPRFARCEKIFTWSISLRPAAVPPLMPNVITDPCPFGRYFCEMAWYGLDLRPGYFTHEMAGCRSSHSATASALRLCASMRNFSVSIPCMKRHDLNGLMHRPQQLR